MTEARIRSSENLRTIRPWASVDDLAFALEAWDMGARWALGTAHNENMQVGRLESFCERDNLK